MPKIELSNFFGGISFSDRIGREGSFFVGKAVNLFNPSHYGYLCAGPESVLITNTTSEVLAKGVIDDYNKKIYFGDTHGRISEINLATNKATFGTVFPFQISTTTAGHSTHAGPFKISDMVIYNVSADFDRLFFSWRDTTDGDIGEINLSTGVGNANKFYDDLALQVGDQRFPITLLHWGANNMLYACQGGSIHQYDGQNNVWTRNKFLLPYGWAGVSLFDAGEYIGICAKKVIDYTINLSSNFTGTSKVFFWDGVSNSYTRSIPIDDPIIRASLNLNNKFLLFTIDHNKKGLIKQFDGNGFETVQVIGNNVTGETSGHYPTSHGSVGYFRNSVLIGEKNHGNLFLYGSPEKGISELLCNPISFTATTTQIGSPILGESGEIYFNAWDGSVGSIRRANIGTVNSGRMLFKSLYYEFGQRAKINYIKLYFKELASGQGDDILLDLDYGKSQVHAGSISFAKYGAITQKRLAVNKNCNNFRILIQPDEGAGIKYGKIVVDFDLLEDEID